MSSISFDKLLQLAQQRAVDGKAGLAASITKICLQSDLELSADERRLTYEILEQLVNDVEIEVRRYIADYLAQRNDVPRRLLDFLANDTIHVAYPILVHSGQLDDAFLLDLIGRKQQGHHLAICERETLSVAISRALVETGETIVLEKLASNSGAEFDVEIFNRLITLSEDNVTLQHKILNRNDLPADQVQRMYNWVGEATRQYILRNYEIPDDLLNAATLDSIAHVTKKSKEARDLQSNYLVNYEAENINDQTPLSAPPYQQHNIDHAHADQLITILKHGGRDTFIKEYSLKAEVSMELTNKIFDLTQINAIALACKAMAFTPRQFEILIEKFAEERFYNFAHKNLLTKAIDYYQRVDMDKAVKQLHNWQKLSQ